jgi:hypothetical protein
MTMKSKESEKYELALDLIDGAEEMVRTAEQALEAAEGYTGRDLAETELQACLEVQDRILKLVAPTIVERRKEIARHGWEAIRAMADAPGSDFLAKRRRYMRPAVKSWLISKIGRRAYMMMPW